MSAMCLEGLTRSDASDDACSDASDDDLDGKRVVRRIVATRPA